jgi:hypothetical protein
MTLKLAMNAARSAEVVSRARVWRTDAGNSMSDKKTPSRSREKFRKRK